MHLDSGREAERELEKHHVQPPPPVLHASAAFLEVLLELLEDRGGANHIIQSWDTSTCVIEVFFEVVQP